MDKCIICLQESHENLWVNTLPICLECEQVIVSTDVDHPFYPLFMDQLKGIYAV